MCDVGVFTIPTSGDTQVAEVHDDDAVCSGLKTARQGRWDEGSTLLGYLEDETARYFEELGLTPTQTAAPCSDVMYSCRVVPSASSIGDDRNWVMAEQVRMQKWRQNPLWTKVDTATLSTSKRRVESRLAANLGHGN